MEVSIQSENEGMYTLYLGEEVNSLDIQPILKEH